jgi:hypothetical protein
MAGCCRKNHAPVFAGEHDIDQIARVIEVCGLSSPLKQLLLLRAAVSTGVMSRMPQCHITHNTCGTCSCHESKGVTPPGGRLWGTLIRQPGRNWCGGPSILCAAVAHRHITPQCPASQHMVVVVAGWEKRAVNMSQRLTDGRCVVGACVSLARAFVFWARAHARTHTHTRR